MAASTSERLARLGGALGDSGEVVRFRAFTATSIVTGNFDLQADRLTDALNLQTELHLEAVTVLDFATMEERRIPSLQIARAELLIVAAEGRRGSVRRRFRPLPHAVTLTIGPYQVEGKIHTPLGADPTAIYHRQPMIPLTDVTVSHPVMGRPITDEFRAVIVNRDGVTSIVRGGAATTHWHRAEPRTPGGPTSTDAGTEAGSAAIAAVLQPSIRKIKILSDPTITPAYLPRNHRNAEPSRRDDEHSSRLGEGKAD